MIIDCERCEVRGLACGNCAVPAIVTLSVASASVVTTTTAGQAPELGPAEVRALRTLAKAGLIAPLRYAPRVARAS
jgi:hypothetical protein